MHGKIVLDMGNSKTVLKVAKRIKGIRKEKRLTQIEVAEKAGISPNYYARVECGEARPSADTYEAIAKALKITSSDIFPF